MIDTDGLSTMIQGLSRKRQQDLYKFLTRKYKLLNKPYINNSTLFDIYTIILNYVYSFVPENKIPNTITLPQYVNILSTGVELKEHLIMTIKRAPMYVGTDNPETTNPFKNKIQNMLNNVSNDTLYTISLDGIMAHPTTSSEFKEFLNHLEIK